MEFDMPRANNSRDRDLRLADELMAAAAHGESEHVAEMRTDLHPHLSQLRPHLEERFPDEFGGFWIDSNGDDLTVNIGVVGLAKGLIDTACGGFVRTDLLRFVPHDVSYVELEQEMRTLSAWRQEQLWGDDQVPDIVIDERLNRIVIEAPGTDTGAYQRARNAMRHPDVLSVVTVERTSEPDSCVRTNCRPFMIGGLSVGCTTGFAARRGAVDGVLTAGHCNNVLSHAGVSIGPVTAEMEAGPVDAQFHALPAGSWVPRARILVDNNLVRDVTSSMNPADDYIDMTVCVSGRLTGFNCGRITHRDMAPHYIPGSFGFRRATYQRQQGDSGAPVVLGLTAVGIHSGADPGTGQGMFGNTVWASNALGAPILTRTTAK